MGSALRVGSCLMREPVTRISPLAFAGWPAASVVTVVVPASCAAAGAAIARAAMAQPVARTVLLETIERMVVPPEARASCVTVLRTPCPRENHYFRWEDHNRSALAAMQ